MKKVTRILMAAFVLTAFSCLAACDSDEEKPTLDPVEDFEPSSTYAIYVDTTEILAGHTFVYNATKEEVDDDLLMINFVVENKTGETLSTTHKVELVSGPSEFANYRICAGITCPWNEQPYNMAPGMNPLYPIQYDIHPQSFTAGTSGRYKLTVGRADDLSDPQVVFFRVNL